MKKIQENFFIEEKKRRNNNPSQNLLGSSISSLILWAQYHLIPNSDETFTSKLQTDISNDINANVFNRYMKK